MDLTLTIPVFIDLDPGEAVLVKSSSAKTPLGRLRIVSGDKRLYSFRLHQTPEGSTWQRVALPAGWSMILSGKLAPGDSTAYFTNSEWTEAGSGTTLAYTATLDFAVASGFWGSPAAAARVVFFDIEIRDATNAVRGTWQFEGEVTRENYGSGDEPADPDEPFLDRPAADNIYLSFVEPQTLTGPQQIALQEALGVTPFDASAPGPIGGTTPDSGTFTTVNATDEVRAGSFTTTDDSGYINGVGDAGLNNLTLTSTLSVGSTSYFAQAATFDESITINGPIDAVDGNFGGNVTIPAAPTASSHAVNKAYVDSLITGLKWKASVVVATTANGTLATAFANGQTVDGVVVATGDRILLKDQSTASQNGIYTVNASGSPTRATDADTGPELVSAAVCVQTGTVNADRSFVCTSNSINIGSTSITWVSFASTIGALVSTNNLSDLANAATARTNLGLTIGTNVQAYSANLATFAAIAPSANVQTLLGAATFAAFKASLTLGNVENTALSTWAGSTSIVTVGTITSGTWTGTAIALANGGTGATSAKGAVTNLVTVTDNANTAITLADSDSGGVLRCTAATAVTITVPSTLAAGFNLLIIQAGAGQVTVSAGSGTTLNSYASLVKTAGQHAGASLLRTAAATYNLSGNLA